jgi:CheY-like chemotaxis protein
VVLVADDEPSMLALVSTHLRARGYRVLQASDGDQAWALAHEHLPDLVVLDVMMPGMSGWEVCRKIREAVSLAHTGVVMLTGIGENLNELTSPLYGADAYIDKPFEFAEFDAKIRETLERRKRGALGRPDRADVESSAPEFTFESTPPVPQRPAKQNVSPVRKRRAVPGARRSKAVRAPARPIAEKGGKPASSARPTKARRRGKSEGTAAGATGRRTPQGVKAPSKGGATPKAAGKTAKPSGRSARKSPPTRAGANPRPRTRAAAKGNPKRRSNAKKRTARSKR